MYSWFYKLIHHTMHGTKDITISWECLRIQWWGRRSGLRRTRLQNNGGSYVVRIFRICTIHHTCIPFRWSSQGRWDEWACSREIHISLWWETWRKKHSEDLGVDGRMTLKCTLNKQDLREWADFIWLRIGTNCGLFWHGNEPSSSIKCNEFLNTLNAKLNPICHLLALVGAHHILHVSRIRVN